MAEPRDWIAAEFADLRSRAVPLVRPPGISAAVDTVQRRQIRNRTLTAAIAATALVALAAGLLGLPVSRSAPPIDQVTPSPAATPSASASAEPAQAAAASPEPSQPPSSARCNPTLDFRSVRQAPGAGNTVEVLYRRRPSTTPYCANAFWRIQMVSYSGDWQGDMRLHISTDVDFDANMFETTLIVRLPATCTSVWYVLPRDVAVRQSFQWPPGEPSVQLYPGRTIDRGERRDCVSPAPSPAP